MVDLLRIIIIIGLVWWAFFRENKVTNILTVLALGIASLISLDMMMNYHGSKIRGLGIVLYGTFVIFFVETLIYIYVIFRRAISKVIKGTYGYILRKMMSFIILSIVTVFIYYVVGAIAIEEFGVNIFTSLEYTIKSSIIVLSIVFFITQYFLGTEASVPDKRDVVDDEHHTIQAEDSHKNVNNEFDETPFDMIVGSIDAVEETDQQNIYAEEEFRQTVAFERQGTYSFLHRKRTKIDIESQKLVNKNETLAQENLSFLYFKGIDSFYHFTEVSNLESIIENGGLYSWNGLEHRGINASLSSNELSRQLDVQKNLQDYVRVSFSNYHPMSTKVELEDGKKLVWLEIDLDVALWESTLFSDMNATDNNVTVQGGFDFLKNLDFDVFKQRYNNLNSLEKKKYQAEILVKDFLPIKYITNIDILKVKYIEGKEIPF